MTLRFRLRVVLASLVLASSLSTASAQSSPAPNATSESAMPSVITVPEAARASDHFDAAAATEAYLAQIPPAAKARSDAYFEGGYWLILWDFLYGIAVSFLLLSSRLSARMRGIAEALTSLRPLQTLAYWVQYLLVTSVLGFPLAVYEGYFREHEYGLATQTFGPWLGDLLKGLALEMILGGLLVMALFGIVRRAPRTWHLWGAGLTLAFMIFVSLIAPVYILPLFNKVNRLDDPKVTAPILQLARANGIPVHDVFEVDASRQSNRMSANVSGFGNTMRITLNDNLLRRGSPEEIQAVMGHEMGHYVLNHVYKSLLFFLVVIAAAFAFLRATLDGSLRRWGARWDVRDVGDPAVLPLVALLGSLFLFVLTPILNSYIRSGEQEADMYGLNASRQPDGFAQAAIHLGEYRKMSPGPLEEWVFFDHPSGHTRIYNAMRWKGENLSLSPAP
ncbi:MAG TPA: M48 family metallopeptidase [Thermoanaerobaculia bacterium]|nr:M48 family metallopeptidase [Thermoanaerobaculia bacterium]